MKRFVNHQDNEPRENGAKLAARQGKRQTVTRKHQCPQSPRYTAMSYAGYKLLHAPTAVDFCVTAYLTHCPTKSTSSDRTPATDLRNSETARASTSLNTPSKSDVLASKVRNLEPDDMDLLTSSPEILSTPWQVAGAHALAKCTAPPNLVIAKAHVLEVYYLRVGSPNSEKDHIHGGEVDESKSCLELACEYRCLTVDDVHHV